MGKGRVRSDRRGVSGQGSGTILKCARREWENRKWDRRRADDNRRTRTYHARVQVVLRLDADDHVEGAAGRDDRLGLWLGRGGERALAHGSRWRVTWRQS
jgi:hypothetical protein